MKTMTEQELFNVPVPTATESYAPVSHEAIVTGIETELDKVGLSIDNRNYQYIRGGERVIGTFDVATGDDEFNYRVAFQNSYDKSVRLAFVAGTSVMICSNGMILGDEKFVRKHTGTVNAEFQEQLKVTVGNLDNVLTTAIKHADQMKSIELDPRAIAELCGRWFLEEEIIRSSQLNEIKKQLHKPDHEVFADNTLWSLYNHATHALKKTTPEVYLEKYKQLHSFVEREYELI
jgi:hypothetical protein